MTNVKSASFLISAATLMATASLAYGAPVMGESGIPSAGPITYSSASSAQVPAAAMSTGTAPATALPFTKPAYETQHYGQPAAPSYVQPVQTAPAQATPVANTDAGKPVALTPVTPSAVEPQQQNNIAFVTGGIGDEEREALNEAKARYNLHVLSSSRDGAFTGDTKLSIQDHKGNTLVTADAGPLFYAALPAGKYVLMAENNGMEQKKPISIGKGGSSNVHLVW